MADGLAAGADGGRLRAEWRSVSIFTLTPQ